MSDMHPDDDRMEARLRSLDRPVRIEPAEMVHALMVRRSQRSRRITLVGSSLAGVMLVMVLVMLTWPQTTPAPIADGAKASSDSSTVKPSNAPDPEIADSTDVDSANGSDVFDSEDWEQQMQLLEETRAELQREIAEMKRLQRSRQMTKYRQQASGLIFGRVEYADAF